MSKIKNGGLDQYGAEPFEQQQFRTAGTEGVNYTVVRRKNQLDWKTQLGWPNLLLSPAIYRHWVTPTLNVLSDSAPGLEWKWKLTRMTLIQTDLSSQLGCHLYQLRSMDISQAADATVFSRLSVKTETTAKIFVPRYREQKVFIDINIRLRPPVTHAIDCRRGVLPTVAGLAPITAKRDVIHQTGST